MSFSYYMPVKVFFGCGEFDHAGVRVASFGKKVLVVCGRRAMSALGYRERLERMLQAEGLEVRVFNEVSPDPRTSEVNACVERFAKWRPEVIVALGGGSAMDAAKGIALGLTVGEAVEPYLAGTKAVCPVELPVVAIPTTAGTGSETNRAAILSDSAGGYKSSFRHDTMFPKAAIIDPLLTVSLSAKITRETGFDVLAHAMETVISRAADNPLTWLYAEKAIRLLGSALPQAIARGEDRQARTDMAYAAMLMGFNLANSSTCLPHRLQYPLAVTTGTSHGAGLMALFRSWLENTYSFSAERFDPMGSWLAGGTVSGKEEFLKAYDDFVQRCGEPVRLRDLGVTAGDIDGLTRRVSGNLANDPAGDVPGIVQKIYEGAL
ncbi:MAG TPA: iron-containing alcohol dehydrogenase [Patescibacteria group bacterium]|nr:iron-containing alcohol dehydrogenase [Patescibacteria group bacterium]